MVNRSRPAPLFVVDISQLTFSPPIRYYSCLLVDLNLSRPATKGKKKIIILLTFLAGPFRLSDQRKPFLFKTKNKKKKGSSAENSRMTMIIVLNKNKLKKKKKKKSRNNSNKMSTWFSPYLCQSIDRRSLGGVNRENGILRFQVKMNSFISVDYPCGYSK